LGAGARAQIFDCHFGANQQFFIEDLNPPTNVKRLVARHSGLQLDVFGAFTANAPRAAVLRQRGR
jgi:hypothetical protein